MQEEMKCEEDQDGGAIYGNHSDPELYRRMCKPHEDVDVLKERLMEFYADVGKLRRKYKIADVYFVTRNFVKVGGEVRVTHGTFNYGNSAFRLTMSGTAYRAEMQHHEQLLNQIALDSIDID